MGGWARGKSERERERKRAGKRKRQRKRKSVEEDARIWRTGRRKHPTTAGGQKKEMKQRDRRWECVEITILKNGTYPSI